MKSWSEGCMSESFGLIFLLLHLVRTNEKVADVEIWWIKSNMKKVSECGSERILDMKDQSLCCASVSQCVTLVAPRHHLTLASTISSSDRLKTGNSFWVLRWWIHHIDSRSVPGPPSSILHPNSHPVGAADPTWSIINQASAPSVSDRLKLLSLQWSCQEVWAAKLPPETNPEDWWMETRSTRDSLHFCFGFRTGSLLSWVTTVLIWTPTNTSEEMRSRTSRMLLLLWKLLSYSFTLNQVIFKIITLHPNQINKINNFVVVFVFMCVWGVFVNYYLVELIKDWRVASLWGMIKDTHTHTHITFIHHIGVPALSAPRLSVCLTIWGRRLLPLFFIPLFSLCRPLCFIPHPPPSSPSLWTVSFPLRWEGSHSGNFLIAPGLWSLWHWPVFVAV